MKWQWFWYLAGAIVTLIWKWQRHCYANRSTVGFWRASREWFELETLGSQVSWGATIGGVWLIGTTLIEKTGAAWLAGGIFMDVPVYAPLCFFIGSITEMIIPAFTKWIVGKFGGGQ